MDTPRQTPSRKQARRSKRPGAGAQAGSHLGLFKSDMSKRARTGDPTQGKPSPSICYLSLKAINFSFQVKQHQKYGTSQTIKKAERNMVGMMVCTVTVFVVANSFNCIYFLLWTHKFYSKETANSIWITKNLIFGSK